MPGEGWEREEEAASVYEETSTDRLSPPHSTVASPSCTSTGAGVFTVNVTVPALTGTVTG